MKPYKVDEYEIEDIGTEMANQNNRATQYLLFVIQVDAKQYVSYDGDWEEKERCELMSCDTVCDKCETEYADGNGPDYPDDCEKCPEDAFNYYRNIKEFALMAGVFFTYKSCQRHISENKYHYTNPVVYTIGAWRNPEMQAVMKLLSHKGTPDNSLPMFYR